MRELNSVLTIRNAQRQKRLQEKLETRTKTISQYSLENQSVDAPTQSPDMPVQSHDMSTQSRDIKEHQPTTKLQDILASVTSKISEDSDEDKPSVPPLINENIAKMVASVSLRHRKVEEVTFGSDSSDEETIP